MPPCGGHLKVLIGLAKSSTFQVVPPCGGHQEQGAAEAALIDGFKSCPRVGGIFCWISSRAVALRFKSCPRVGGIHAPDLCRIQ